MGGTARASFIPRPVNPWGPLVENLNETLTAPRSPPVSASAGSLVMGPPGSIPAFTNPVETGLTDRDDLRKTLPEPDGSDDLSTSSPALPSTSDSFDSFLE